MTTVYPVDRARGMAYSVGSRGDMERTYRLARRHSRYVRWLRLGLPAGVAALLLIVVVSFYMPPVGGFRLPGELGKLVINGTKITMDQPRLSGFTADGRPYQFTANSAAQDITKPEFMELKQLQAKIKMQDESTVDMSATSGTYDIKGEILTLHNDVHLVSSTGYEARLSEAVVNMRNGGVVSEKPVWVKLLNGFLNAKRLEVVDNGSVLRFDGGVAMTLRQDKSSEKAGEP